MNKIGFLKVLLSCVLNTLFVCYLISLFIDLSAYWKLTFASILFFSFLSIIIYFLGERAMKSNRTNSFLSIIVINTFAKLVGSFLFVLAYVKMAEPKDNLFLIPFLLSYLIFMIGETYFLTIQARQSKVN